MIPANGYFTTSIVTSGGYDKDGQPTQVSSTTGKRYNCRIQTVTYNKQGVYEDGKFINSSHILFIPIDKTFSSDEVELFREGISIGKFAIQSTEHLMMVGKTKIII